MPECSEVFTFMDINKHIKLYENRKRNDNRTNYNSVTFMSMDFVLI